MWQTRSNHWKTACGLAVAVIGLSALAGWVTGQRLLSGMRSDYIPMAPNTAIGFLLLGIALVAMPGDIGSLRRKAIAVGAAGFVAGLAGCGLVEYLLSIELGVHDWFLRVPTERLGLAPVGKMALFTALTFEAASLAALLCAVSPRRSALDYAGLLGLAVMAIRPGVQPRISVRGPLVLWRPGDPDGAQHGRGLLCPRHGPDRGRGAQRSPDAAVRGSLGASPVAPRVPAVHGRDRPRIGLAYPGRCMVCHTLIDGPGVGRLGDDRHRHRRVHVLVLLPGGSAAG